MQKRGQVSTEYLIVFGIAFMIIITGTFAFLKFAKSGVFSKQQCLIVEPGIECEGFAKDYSYSPLQGCFFNYNKCLRMSIKNNLEEDIYLWDISFKEHIGVSQCGTGICGTDIYGIPNASNPIIILSKTSKDFLIYDEETTPILFKPGAKINTDFTLEYSIGTPTSFKHSLTGYMSGRFLPEKP